jgi:hypothetical protein
MRRRLRATAARWLREPGDGPGGEARASGLIGFTAALTDDERRVVEQVQPYSLTSPERIIATCDAVEHAVRRNVAGALVECGVWRGGMVLAMLLTLQRLGVDDREVYLYDTFEGMTQPTDADRSPFTGDALPAWEQAEGSGAVAWGEWFGPDQFDLQGVRSLLVATGYPEERLHFVVGKVEDTIPGRAPDEVAVLRLDTDWYESTRHELQHLYPRLTAGGILIIDDYGHWEGCRRAVDEYFADAGPLLTRVDYTCRMAVKS